MIEASEYEQRARAAEGLAQSAKSDDERKAHLEVAAIWRELAQQRRLKIEAREK